MSDGEQYGDLPWEDVPDRPIKPMKERRAERDHRVVSDAYKASVKRGGFPPLDLNVGHVIKKGESKRRAAQGRSKAFFHDGRLTFGKHSGKSLSELLESQQGYLDWASKEIEGFAEALRRAKAAKLK